MRPLSLLVWLAPLLGECASRYAYNHSSALDYMILQPTPQQQPFFSSSSSGGGGCWAVSAAARSSSLLVAGEPGVERSSLALATG